jgi:hypothetical protein
MGVIKALLGWASLADYDAAKERATLDVVSRFARGNTSVQSGQVLDEGDLRQISGDGDRALRSLDRLRHKA